MVLDADTSHRYIFETFINIISVIWNLGFDTLLDITIIALKNIDVTIENMDREFPTGFSFLNQSIYNNDQWMMPHLHHKNSLLNMVKYGLENRYETTRQDNKNILANVQTLIKL